MMQTKLRLVLSIPLLFFGLNTLSQEVGLYWENGSLVPSQRTLSGQVIQQESGRAFMLREEQLRRQLAELQAGHGAETVLSFPDASGTPRKYRVKERSVMSAELQERYPGIRSYVGYSIEGTPSRIRFSFSQKGLQGMIVELGTSRGRRYLVTGRPDA